MKNAYAKLFKKEIHIFKMKKIVTFCDKWLFNMAFCAFNVLLAERAWGRMGKASTNPPCSHQIYTKSAAEDSRTSSCCSSCSWWGCISHRWRFSLFFSCSKRIWAEMLMWQVVVIIIIINNCIAKWRLSAWDIQELSLLAASS